MLKCRHGTILLIFKHGFVAVLSDEVLAEFVRNCYLHILLSFQEKNVFCRARQIQTVYVFYGY